MRKNVLIILLIILTYGTASSQSLLGIKGSFNTSSLTTGSAINRAGFSIGAMYSTEMADFWYFQPSLLYTLSGTKSKSGHKPSYSAHTYSLEVPLIISRRFGDDDITFGLDFGPFFKYGLHGGYWQDNLETGNRDKLDIFDHQKRFDVGPQAGFSMLIYGIHIGYYFQYGLIKPWDDKKGNYYNSCISFGYLFELP